MVCFSVENLSYPSLSLTATRTVVYRSEHINNHLNPYWAPFSLSLEELCYCDLNWPLKLTVFDYQENGSHRVIGEVETTTQLLSQAIAFRGNADREKALEIFGESKSKSRHLKTRGLLVILKADIALTEDESNAPEQVTGSLISYNSF